MKEDFQSLFEELHGRFPPVAAVAVETPAPAAEVQAPDSEDLPKAEVAPKPVAEPKHPVEKADYAAKGYHLNLTVAPDDVVAAAEFLDDHSFSIDTITGVDWLAANEMEVVYDYFHFRFPWRVVVRTRLPRNCPELPTISSVFPGADWHERETHDFFGIRFLGHPNLTPLLLPENADYHPLRKDYSA